MRKQSTEKRLYQYALKFKATIIAGLGCLTIAVGLELVGPFIAKNVIDNHITGIETTWVQVEEKKDAYTVYYEENWYKREDRLQTNDEALSPAYLFQIGRDYYITEEEIGTTEKLSVQKEEVIEEQTGDIIPADKLSTTEVYRFFKPEQRPIAYLLSFYAILLLIAAYFQYWKTFLLQKASNQIVEKMRNDVFSHTQKVPINYFVNRPAGKIVARITNDTEAIRDLFERVLSEFFTSFIYMTGIYIALFLLDARLALFCLLVIPIMYVWMKVYKHFGTKYNKVIRSTVSEINGNINESIRGMSVIQAFQKEKQMTDEFEQKNQRHFVYQKKLVKLSALTSYNLVNVLRNLAFVAFIWYFGSAAIRAESIVTIGVLYAFVDFLTRLFQPITNVINQLPLLEQARVAAGRVFELLDHPGEELEWAEIEKYQGHIRFEQVNFSYNEKDKILHDIDFEVMPGETVAFVGHTGSGKSSIMNLLFRFYDPQQGRILIDGMDIAKLSRQQVRSHMGIVLQDPVLFTGTVLSNVTMNDPHISREIAIESLEAVGASSFIKKLPDGYDEQVKEGGSTFSMGERQLVSFARALAFDPAILILDEATANIDTETEKIIQQALAVLKKGRTTLMIAHRLSTIQQADQILVLQDGMIKERGSHEQLLNQKGMYHHMFEMQQGRIKGRAV